MDDQKKIKLGKVASKALELLKTHPEGLTMAKMRDMLDESHASQEHFNRRIREIRKYYELRTEKSDEGTLYILGPYNPQIDSGHVSEKLRAAVIHKAHGKCQMCGQTINEDGVKLQADHKIPQSWGGETELENLWAICEPCNRGKKNFFASFNSSEMEAVVHIKSVHERIARFLKLHSPEPVPDWAIEFVANCRDQQRDWPKRLRELRYKPIGLVIEVSKKKVGKGVQSLYALKNWRDLPEDHVKVIKEYERQRKED